MYEISSYYYLIVNYFAKLEKLIIFLFQNDKSYLL